MIIFEDSEDTPSSKLLKLLLGPQVTFAQGCERIPEVLMRSSDKLNIVLLDVVPDNNMTSSYYNVLNNEYANIENVQIFKIPCIEYFILLMLKQLNCLTETKDAKLFFKLQNGESISYAANSFENFCKSIVKQQLPVFKRNAGSTKFAESGRFYTNACLCTLHKPKCTQNVTAIKKGCTLLRLLPIVPYDFNEMTSTVEIYNYIKNNSKQINKDIEHIYRLLTNID